MMQLILSAKLTIVHHNPLTDEMERIQLKQEKALKTNAFEDLHERILFSFFPLGYPSEIFFSLKLYLFVSKVCPSFSYCSALSSPLLLF